MIKSLIGAVAGLASLGLLVATAPVQAEDFEASAEEFRISCAPCHGVDGTGNGYLVRESKGAINAPDLTQLSKNNGGVFPLPQVFMSIDGGNPIGAHGDSAMPIWGERYSSRAKADGLSADDRMRAVRARVLELVYYLQSIQTVHVPEPERGDK